MKAVFAYALIEGLVEEDYIIKLHGKSYFEEVIAIKDEILKKM